jgi:pimeloyl-ACP methyl ester carboxylesterase
MGAVAALLAAPGDPRIRALVLDSPFADLVSTIDHNLGRRGIPPALVRGPLLAIVAIRARYEPRTVRPIDAMRAIAVPVLLLHGTDDRLVPFGNAEALAGAAPDVVRLVPLAGSGHNDPRPADLDDTIRDFLSVALATRDAGTITQP